MSETVYNSHGISIDRTESKWTGTTGFSKTNICTLIKAGQTAIMEINETLSYGNGTLGNGNATYGHVLLCGQWSVHQSLNAPNSTIATDDLPPAYSRFPRGTSRFPRATSSAEPATYTKTAIRVEDCTVVKPGVRVFQKYIEICLGSGTEF